MLALKGRIFKDVITILKLSQAAIVQLSSSKQRTSANVFNNGVKIGLAV
jgi:hypothetical protein